MPRANRHFQSGHVCHLTHRCHHKAFLLKFACDRRRYLHWVFEATKRFGISVLDYYLGYSGFWVAKLANAISVQGLGNCTAEALRSRRRGSRK